MITIPEWFVSVESEVLWNILDKIEWVRLDLGDITKAYCAVLDGGMFVNMKEGNIEWKGNRVVGVVNDDGRYYADPYYLKADKPKQTKCTDLVKIQCRSVMGWLVWVTSVTESGPLHVAMTNDWNKGKNFERSKAEQLLPSVKTVHPEAEIVEFEVKQ